MAYPQLTNSLEFRRAPDFRRYVLEVKPDREPGRLYVEVLTRGKAPTWREVPKDGPSYQEVVNKEFMDRVAALELKPERSAIR